MSSIHEISRASTDNVTSAESVSAATQQITASTQEPSASARQMAQLPEELATLVSQCNV